MARKVVLAVTKDLGAANAIIPIIDELARRGYGIFVACEGLSIDTWRKTDYPLLFTGSKDFEKSPYRIPVAVVEDLQPNLVLSGLSRPIFLEEEASEIANRYKIPLVWVEDLWQCHTRTKIAKPQGIITLDKLGEQLINQAHNLSGAQVCIAGNPAIKAAATKPVPPATLAALEGLGSPERPRILIAGQGAYTTDILRVGLLTAARSAPNPIVIIRLHPKYLAAHGETWKRQIEEAKRDLPNLEIIDDLPVEHKTDDIARAVDATISTSSTTLLMAAAAHKVPVSVVTEMTKSGMQEIAPGLERYPLVSEGAAIEIPEPRALALKELQRELKGPQVDYFSTWSVDRAANFVASFIDLDLSFLGRMMPKSVPLGTLFQFQKYLNLFFLADEDIESSFRRSSKNEFKLRQRVA